MRLVRHLGLLAFVACSSFSDTEDASPDGGRPDDAGIADARAEEGGDAATDASSDGGLDAGADVVPAGMIVVKTSATEYLIDAHEVTHGEFVAFKEKVVQNGLDAGMPPECAFKTELGPTITCQTRPAGAAAGCVDWCDAFAYCKFVGKRLCGRIGGGEPLSANEAVDGVKAEWARACAGEVMTVRWPYGTDASADACNTDERPGAEAYDAGAMPSCVGGEPGLFDMSGNVSELDDSCTTGSGASDTCYAHGGSFYEIASSSRCNDQIVVSRGSAYVQVGFRCCKDL